MISVYALSLDGGKTGNMHTREEKLEAFGRILDGTGNRQMSLFVLRQ